MSFKNPTPLRNGLSILCALLLLLYSFQVVHASDSAKQGNFHLSLGGFYLIQDDDKLENSANYSIQLAASVKAIQVGIEAGVQLNTPHNYQYHVPYNTAKESRDLDIYNGLLLLRFSPWHHGYVTPYIGGFLGGSYVVDQAPDSIFFDSTVSEDKVIIGGGLIGLEVLPAALMSIFIEARQSYQLFGHLQRQIVTDIDLFGNQRKKTEEYKLNAFHLGAGFRFNF